MKAMEVACGSSFSVARECNPVEGSQMVYGFKVLEAAIRHLAELYPESDAIQWAWAEVRQEKFSIDRVCTGLLTTWGTGKAGQLGLGKHLTFSPYPRVVPTLKCQPIKQVSAGENHVLCVDLNGRLYSWGCGKSGRLGHQV